MSRGWGDGHRNSQQHESYRYSITIHSGDLPVVGCLRALAQYSLQTGNNRIPWGGTKDTDWLNEQHRVTFHFTSADYRAGFLDQAARWLLPGSWREVRSSDSDPAHPQA